MTETKENAKIGSKLDDNENNTEKYLFDKIREFKMDNSKINDFDSTSLTIDLSLDKIIEQMEDINKVVQKFYSTDLPTIKDHLVHTISKSKSFEDVKFECIFKIQNMGTNVEKKSRNLSNSVLDYSIREKLIGFVPRHSKLQWEEGKIKDFLESISKSNRS